MKKRHIVQAVLFLCMMVLVAPAAHAQLLGVTWEGDLYDVSTSDGSLSFIGDTGLVSALSLAYNGTLYSIGYDGSTIGLFSIDTSSATATLVGPTAALFGEGALAFDTGGTLWAVSGVDIYTVDTTTAATTYQGSVSGKGDINGLAFRSDGSLIGIDGVSDTIFSINLTTFAATDIASFGFDIGLVSGLASMGDTGYMATGTPTNALYEVNLSTGATSSTGSFDSWITSGNGMAGLALVQDVPEPATLLLLGAGLLGFGIVRRKVRS